MFNKYLIKNQLRRKTIIGWREWVDLPELGINKIKAKIDTGARTSALHAFDIELYQSNNNVKVKFKVHPIQYNDMYVINCEADLLDQRDVKNSGGEIENRYIIKTMLWISNSIIYPIELTLTNRTFMGFRLLLGRTAFNKRFLINPDKSFLTKMK